MLYSEQKLEKLRQRWATKKGKELLETIKSAHCYLSLVLFRKRVGNFPGSNDPEIRNSIDLRGVNFSGFDFRTKVKDGDEGFSEDLALLDNIHFEGAALKHCDFEEGRIHNCHFENSDLSHAEFRNSSLNGCTFQEADCTNINLHGSKLIKCNFTNAAIRDVVLDTTIVDQKTTFGEKLKSEQENNLHSAAIEYKQIKEMYKNSSLHNLADKYHYREMVAKRKLTSKTNPLRWFNYVFGDLLCKYGTSFNRVLLWSVLVIVGCAFLVKMNNSLLYYNASIKTSFGDALYFSINSFTTLGYGDYHPIGLIRFVAAGEAFVGAALMSLFTVIVARNIIRD